MSNAPATEPVSKTGAKGAKGAKAESKTPRGKVFQAQKMLTKEDIVKNQEMSLTVVKDPRLNELTHFTGCEETFNRLHAKRAAASGVRAAELRVTIPEDAAGCPMPVSPSAMREREMPVWEPFSADTEDRPIVFKKTDVDSINHAGRIQFEDSFNGTVKRLLVDFDLHQDAGCRYNHLRRLHSWFEHQRSSEGRKKKAPPSFMELEIPKGGVAGRWPKGSPRNVDAPLSDACVVSSSNWRMKRSRQLASDRNQLAESVREDWRPMTARY